MPSGQVESILVNFYFRLSPEMPPLWDRCLQYRCNVKRLLKPGIKHLKQIHLQFLLIPSIFKRIGNLPSFFGFALLGNDSCVEIPDCSTSSECFHGGSYP